ncbi:response regulator [Dyella sp. 2RAB6]|uniref:response regulator n=1 Tax=Dyella sp. 2RAB6 TaxID=3232992 RepID=UPI003F8E2459
MSEDSFNGEAGDQQSPAPRALVVEDQDDVRAILCAMLEELGFEVMNAINADVAHALLTADGRFDLLLTDVNMPGSLDGAQLAALARQIDPSMKVVVTSGRIDEVAGRLPSDLSILGKPFGMEELVAVVGNRRHRPDEQASDVVA